MKPTLANDNLIVRSRRVWQLRLGRDHSREDARQIAETVNGAFAILADWSRPPRCVREDDQQRPVASKIEEARQS